MWTDSHCHVPWEGVGFEVIGEARDAGVTRLISVGTDGATSAAAIEVARAHDGVWATVGLHPHEASAGVESIKGFLTGDPSVVAVGECGLDYFYEHSPRDAQREAFAAQIALAKEHGLALVVHTRDAWDDTFDILRVEGAPERWVLHCFTGGPAEARMGIELGAMLSFSGIITFKNAGDVREAAAICPLDRLLVETDSPFLAPVPHRGKVNTPAFVTIVGAAVAEAAGVDVETVERSTWDNAERLFGL
ncbi:MAG TPA: TatD family hydrolase [Acidimicrobiales bacterium]|nr:TatD family hydrolase [Acidimicrobiales bacterium]